MKIYVVLKEDVGYLGYGRDIGCGTTVEFVCKSLDDAISYIQENYKCVCDVKTEYQYYIDAVREYRWFADGMDDHVYEFIIHEKELV